MAASHYQTSGILVGQNKTKYWRSLAFGILSQIRIKQCPISNIGGKNFTAEQRLSAAVVVGIGDGGDDDDDDGDDGDDDDDDEDGDEEEENCDCNDDDHLHCVGCVSVCSFEDKVLALNFILLILVAAIFHF